MNGERLIIEGKGGAMVNGTTEVDVPPASVTVMFTVPAVAISLTETEAVSSVELT